MERETLHVMDDKQRIALVETQTIEDGDGRFMRRRRSSAINWRIIWARPALRSTKRAG